MTDKINMFEQTSDAFCANLTALGMPTFVGKQVYDWVMKKYQVDFQLMTNISKPNRELLSEHYTISALEVTQRLSSADGQAVKYIFTTQDNRQIESVVIRSLHHSTLCISSQIGCSLKCKFCLTGTMGCQRNLTVSEIVSQLLHVKHDGEPISHIVFMGMGEPLLNLNNVLAAIDFFSSETGFHISKRRIIVSTCGIVAGIDYLIENDITLDLALSVGSAVPYKRQILMPVEGKNPLMTVSTRLKEYASRNNRMLTLEYTLLAGQNDEDADITALMNLARYLNAKVNLINFNPHEKLSFSPVSQKRLQAIKTHLEDAGIIATVRLSKGQDIGAACGQLGD